MTTPTSHPFSPNRVMRQVIARNGVWYTVRYAGIINVVAGKRAPQDMWELYRHTDGPHSEAARDTYVLLPLDSTIEDARRYLLGEAP